MTINGTDVSVYGARQWNIEPAHAEIENESEWPPGMANPIMLAGRTGFKKYKITLLVKGATRQVIWDNAARIIAEFLEPARVRFDGFGHSYSEFVFVLVGHSQKESSINRFHLLELEVVGYEESRTTSGVSGYTPATLTYNNPGTLPSPCSIEVTLYSGTKDTVTISGLVRRKNGVVEDLVIRDVEQLMAVKIDDKGCATAGGEGKNLDVDMYALPMVYPGENDIQIKTQKGTAMGCLVGVTYRPRYL